MKHETGPWEFDRMSENGEALIWMRGRGIGLWMYTQTEANARLIASAPDLLAACKQCLEWFENGCHDETMVWVVEMKAAIKQAEEVR